MANGKNFKDKLSLIEFRIMRSIMSAHFYLRRKNFYDQTLMRIRASFFSDFIFLQDSAMSLNDPPTLLL